MALFLKMISINESEIQESNSPCARHVQTQHLGNTHTQRDTRTDAQHRSDKHLQGSQGYREHSRSGQFSGLVILGWMVMRIMELAITHPRWQMCTVHSFYPDYQKECCVIDSMQIKKPCCLFIDA